MPLVLAAIALVGALSAFTTKKADTLYYRNAEGEFLIKPESGNCVNGSFHCTYIWTGAADPGDPQNEGNYDAQGLSSRVFVPAQP